MDRAAEKELIFEKGCTHEIGKTVWTCVLSFQQRLPCAKNVWKGKKDDEEISLKLFNSPSKRQTCRWHELFMSHQSVLLESRRPAVAHSLSWCNFDGKLNIYGSIPSFFDIIHSTVLIRMMLVHLFLDFWFGLIYPQIRLKNYLI